MKDNKVISYKRMPERPMGPIVLGALLYLFFDRFHAPLWCYVVFGVLLFVMLVALLARWMNQEETDVTFAEESEAAKAASWPMTGPRRG